MSVSSKTIAALNVPGDSIRRHPKGYLAAQRTHLLAGVVLILFAVSACSGSQTTADPNGPQRQQNPQTAGGKSGTFVPTGSLLSPRRSQSATLLADGRVLIAGGDWDDHGYVQSAELYDPATGTFNVTDSPGVELVEPKSVLLPDGRVLIGAVAGGPEVYDPKAGTFTAMAARVGAVDALMLLADGNVLVLTHSQGRTQGNNPLASIYNSKTGTMGTATPLYDSTYDFDSLPSETQLSDGRVLVTSRGFTVDAQDMVVNQNVMVADIFDPTTGSLSPTGSLPDLDLGSTTSTLLPDGRVLFVGLSLKANATAELFDPKTGQFSPTGSMSTPCLYCTATVLKDGRVLIVGGQAAGPGGSVVAGQTIPGPSQISAAAQLYDPTSGKFTPTGSMEVARQQFGATLLADGRVLFSGGDTENGDIASCELYVP